MVEVKVAEDRRTGGERRKDVESAKRWMGMQRRVGERRRGNLLKTYISEQSIKTR